MKQHEAVIEAMRRNGGYATLGHLYHAAVRIPGCAWGTKTPFASIRRIVQQHPQVFFKIKPGLWALQAEREAVLRILTLAAEPSAEQTREFDHSYYQGLLVEIGNFKRFQTFIPAQDKNRKFLARRLRDVSTLADFHPFTYDALLRRARTIDVSWFNERKMPQAFFEVEHSTDISNSLTKFVDLQDFRTQFYIVADEARRREFADKIERATFAAVRATTKFLDYEYVSEWHSKIHAAASVEKELSL
jgi:hypothetical protein